MTRHRWNTPLEWLRDHAETWTPETMAQEFINVAVKLTPGQLQDLYQEEMQSDGYFALHLEDGDARIGMRVRVLPSCDSDGYVGAVGTVYAITEHAPRTVRVEFPHDDPEDFAPHELEEVKKPEPPTCDICVPGLGHEPWCPNAEEGE